MPQPLKQERDSISIPLQQTDGAFSENYLA